MITANNITRDQIWEVVAHALADRNARLLGYCDAALRGGRRRRATGRAICADVLNILTARASGKGQP